MHFSESAIDIDGSQRRLAVTAGDAPPILFLHGVLRNWRDFVGVYPSVAPRWRCLGLDHRGHGGSSRAPTYFVRDYVEDLVRSLPRIAAEPVVLFGHSLGAVAAIGAAARFPSAVRALILEDPPAPAFLARLDRTPYLATFQGLRKFAGSQEPVPALAAAIARIEVPGADGRPVELGRLRDATSLRFSARCLRDVDPRVLDPVLEGRWFEGTDWDAWLRAVRCPVLLLRGNEALGGMLPKADADAMLERLADASVIDFPHVGHLIHWLTPETALRHTLSFLETLR